MAEKNWSTVRLKNKETIHANCCLRPTVILEAQLGMKLYPLGASIYRLDLNHLFSKILRYDTPALEIRPSTSSKLK